MTRIFNILRFRQQLDGIRQLDPPVIERAAADHPGDAIRLMRLQARQIVRG